VVDESSLVAIKSGLLLSPKLLRQVLAWKQHKPADRSAVILLLPVRSPAIRAVSFWSPSSFYLPRQELGLRSETTKRDLASNLKLRNGSDDTKSAGPQIINSSDDWDLSKPVSIMYSARLTISDTSRILSRRRSPSIAHDPQES
jgi:hypothetical protein